jgi:electron transport complex protein RnfG
MTDKLNPSDEGPELGQEIPETIDTMSLSILRSAWGLGLFAIITAGLIAVTQLGTKDIIVEQIKKARSKALLEIVPVSEFNNELLDDAFMLPASEELGNNESFEAFVALQDRLPTHIILPVTAPDGYTGPIRLIMSINMSGTLTGVRVIEHKETPGLGDKIDLKKSDWILSFNGKSLDNLTEAQWQVKKDGGEFDQLTGATITPRAIVGAVYEALIFFRKNKEQIIANALQQATELDSNNGAKE